MGARRSPSTSLDLRGVTLVGQDWGGLIGLRLVAEHPDRFAAHRRGQHRPADRRPATCPRCGTGSASAVEPAETLDVARFVALRLRAPASAPRPAAYDAPFPDETLQGRPPGDADARALPGPTTRRARRTGPPGRCCAGWTRRCSAPSRDGDPITGADARRPARELPGAAGREHPTITGAGHFLQEDAGPALAAEIVRFLG